MQANGRASGPVLTSVFFSIFDHSAGVNFNHLYLLPLKFPNFLDEGEKKRRGIGGEEGLQPEGSKQKDGECGE